MFTFSKIERLSSKKSIDELFLKGKSKIHFPLKMVFRYTDFESPFPARVVFVVPKKKHKRANKRNTIKRRMREIYRLNKMNFYPTIEPKKIDIMFICLSNEELSYDVLETSMLQLLKTFNNP
jgi:ribonuclease P protein component